MKERIAIIDGVRTPMDKAGGKLMNVSADDLATHVLKEILLRTGIRGSEIDEVILGNAAQPANAANIARVAALKAGLPISVPAQTVHRNCASGMESITTAADKIIAGNAAVILAGGTESMSNIPLLFNKQMTAFFHELQNARNTVQKIKALLSFRLSFLAPDVGVLMGLTDPISGMIMGMTAEVLAREFHITRQEQDDFALLSHQKAVRSIKKGIFAQEIAPLPLPPYYSDVVLDDGGPRANQSIEALAKLRPYFDRKNGSVTVGNTCPITDGAAAVILMSESESARRNLKPLGYLKAYAYASLEPERMGLGPVYATSKLQQMTGFSMDNIDLVEMNEAFAAQVIANERAFPSAEFAKKHLGRDTAVGILDREKLNVNGGAIALGHPVGMTGTRLVITLLKELRRRGGRTGLATLCIGGGQGAALLLETDKE
jgi:acetyl-CoA C-acetyltransferase/acetyl-CoA acyltransferase